MGSDFPLRLAVIDFSKEDLKPGNPEWDLVKAQVRQAVQEYGCFEALFNKVPLEVQKATFGALEELFDLPLQTKLRNTSKKPLHGYLGPSPQVPLYESMGFDDANIFEKFDSVTNTFWPEGNPSFSKTINSYSEQLSELDQKIRRMILESFGLEKYIDEHMNSTSYLLRVMKYKPPQTIGTELGLTAHTDKGIMAILHQNQVDGLEVQAKNGEWIHVKPSPESFVVMIGDYFYAWLNGRLHCPYHRVMMTGNETRYTIGLFTTPKAGYIIKAPEELVDEEHPLLFKPFYHEEFLKFLHIEANQKAEFHLKAYCGV